jgi:hypothetical protein
MTSDLPGPTPKMLYSLPRHLLAFASLRVGAVLALVSLSLACGSSSGAPAANADGGTPRHDGSTAHDARGDSRMFRPDVATCGAVGLVPALVFVTSATTGEQLCDAVIAFVPDGGVLVGDAGAGIGYPCATDLGGCPSSPPDGGKESCVVLVANMAIHDVTIEISAPGYASKTVSNVSSGEVGCVVQPTPGTQVHIALDPLADGGGAG